VSIIHSKGSPWERVVNFLENSDTDTNSEWYGEFANAIIPMELMRHYFRSLKDSR
jgi:hypothetical protein